MSGENQRDGEAAPGGPDGTPDQPRALAPTGATGRIASLDLIRGIAVLGILAANIVAFGQPMGAYMWPDAFLTEHGSFSDGLWLAQFVLIDGKMRGLFTLLFGAGLALFVERAWARGAGRWLQARRLGWLLVFGLIHNFLIWRGDILVMYAVLGLLALLSLRWSAQRLLATGLVAYGLGAVFYALTIASPYLIADTPMGEGEGMETARSALQAAAAEAGADDRIEAEILTRGSYGDFVAHNIADHAGSPFSAIMLYALETWPLMLIGAALYRFGLFSGALDRARQRRWGWAGLLSGGFLTLAIGLWLMRTGLTYWGTMAGFLAFSHLPRLAMVLGLAALLASWGGQVNGWLAQRLSAAGRMAFSNYLGTSIAMMLVFHPWAGGLWGELSRPQLYLVVLAWWAVMLGWSQPWLARFRYGPLEWLWRCLTYGQVFALRR